jgi:hypothetical protein
MTGTTDTAEKKPPISRAEAPKSLPYMGRTNERIPKGKETQKIAFHNDLNIVVPSIDLVDVSRSIFNVFCL